MHVTVIPGVGPATSERLRRAGISTVADLESVSEDELVRLLGKAHGHGLFQLARAQDDRPVVPERETKSVSVEGTYDTDLTDRRLMEGLVSRQAVNVAERLRKSGLSGRTITLKVRLHDFTTLSRSTTLNAPTDTGPVIARLARGLLGELDLTGGVRLLGVGVSGLADWIQDDLFGDDHDDADDDPVDDLPDLPDLRTWVPGMDVIHQEHGRGWVWGAGRGIVTVRFETADTPPGPVRSLPADDPGLAAWRPPTTRDL
jgi:DNA polymerase-4